MHMRLKAMHSLIVLAKPWHALKNTHYSAELILRPAAANIVPLAIALITTSACITTFQI